MTPEAAPLLLTRVQAAERLSMSLRHLQRHVQPYVRVVRSGNSVHIPVSELERWVAEHMDR